MFIGHCHRIIPNNSESRRDEEQREANSRKRRDVIASCGLTLASGVASGNGPREAAAVTAKFHLDEPCVFNDAKYRYDRS